jgi:hypothetical protein
MAQWQYLNINPEPYGVQLSNGEFTRLMKYSDQESYESWKLRYSDMADSTVSLAYRLYLDSEEKLIQIYNDTKEGNYLFPVRTPNTALEFPEMPFLFSNYDNVFRIASTWSTNAFQMSQFNLDPRVIEDIDVGAGYMLQPIKYRIEATDATVNSIVRNNEMMHTINPKSAFCNIKIISSDNNGNELEIYEKLFFVIDLPKPEILTKTISKSKGGAIDFVNPPMIGSPYQLSNIEFNDTSISGSYIDPEYLQEVKVGREITFKVYFFNDGGAYFNQEAKIRVVK